MKTKIIIRLAVLLAMLAGTVHLHAQGTAFTYQGRLNVGTNPANGSYDLRFRLGDTDTGGNQWGPALTNNAVTVSNGLFTTTLNFGFGVLTGGPRWLQVGVRTNGGSVFEFLSPRTALLPAPYAVYSANAAQAETVSGTVPASGLIGLYSNPVNFNNPANSFSGNGAGLANVNAVTLNGLAGANFWQTGGNAGTTPGANFIGTADNQPLEFKVFGARALRLEPHGASSPGMIGGFLQNSGGGFIGATIAGGGTSASPNLILGNYGFVGAGHGGHAATYAMVGAGAYNSALGQFSFVGTGEWNTNLGLYAGVVAGISNFVGATAEAAFIGGGLKNQATGSRSTIGGGEQNISSGTLATVGGGAVNTSSADGSTVGGGDGNTSSGDRATVGGGERNTSSGIGATVSGGLFNTSSATGATVGGGERNASGGNWATVGGGDLNTSGGQYATVPGGLLNTAVGDYSFAAGRQAKANHQGSFVWADSQSADFASTAGNQFSIRAAGGVRLSDDTPSLSFGTTTRQMLNLWSTAYGIGVQSYNLYFRTDNADGAGSFAWYRGGTHTNAAGDSGGGQKLMSLDNTALRVSAGTVDLNKLLTQGNTNAALCLGYVGYNGITESSVIQSVTAGAGSLLQINPLGGGVSVGGGLTVNGVVRASSGGTEGFEVSGAAAGYALQDRATGAAGRWSMYAFNGTLGFYSASALARVMAVDSAGNVCATSFAPCSDRNVKQDFTAVDTQAVLEKVAQLPIQTWTFKNDPHTKHVGPMAQDFYAAFGTGTDDKHIATVDADGVALAAIQGLNQKLEETRAENSELKQRLEKLEQLMNHKNGGAK